MENWSVYHRWVTFPVALFLPLIVMRIFLQFPNETVSPIFKWILRCFYFYSTVLVLYFFSKTYNAGRIFNFSAENWDFDSDTLSQKVGIGIVLNGLSMMLLGLYKLIRFRNRRILFALFILAFSLIIVIPSYLNVLTRSGELEREIFIKYFCLFCLLGLFIFVVTFLNHTEDPTSFLMKLVATTSTLVLLIIEFVAFESLDDRRQLFDELRKKDAQLSILGVKNTIDTELVKIERGEPLVERRIQSLSEGNIDSFFIQYRVKDPNSEAFFYYRYPYVLYREYFDDASRPIALAILISSLIVLIGIPIFFYLNLVVPLQLLLKGLGYVNEGKLDIQIESRIEDEVGFLTKNFNAMVKSIKEAQSKLLDYANDLEKKVEERTHDLKDSLEKVQDLKNQQDGDYFLTSMLLKPLNMNKAESETVTVEFFTSQKKKFQFKEWKEEIGGDLCIANSIYLKNRKYTVFINADAMGKSLQGAGGAIVLGSVFESIINRNGIEAAQDIFPEIWIKNTFIELHQVFETFEGSMLVSMVLGLVDEETGLLYSINVEHPWSILYRDGKASFIDHKKTYRKLGTLGADGNIEIFTLQLQPDDTFLCGSDGRDDILIINENGEEIINEDESMILWHIENANADLEKIYDRITATGTLIDDITLAKVSFRSSKPEPDEANETESREILEHARLLLKEEKLTELIDFLESAWKSHPRNLKIAKLFFKLLLQNNRFKTALPVSEALIDLDPFDSEIIFLASYVNKKLGNFRKACDLGERVKLRIPKHVKNLINLADSYFMLGDVPRAIYIIESSLKLSPNNKFASDRKAVYLQKSDTIGIKKQFST